MLAKSFVLLAFAVIAISADCPPVAKHYEELRCKAIKSSPSDPCPSHFECPDIEGLEKTKCHFNGKVLALGDAIADKLPTCTKSCKCDGADSEVGFNCQFDECEEAKAEPKKGCAYQFTLDSCCATNVLCDEAAIKDLLHCYSDGHAFVKGNLIYPASSPCHKCICDESFDNSTAPAKLSSCTPVDCGIELHQLSYLQQGGVPVYYKDSCCPFEFTNPSDSDKVIPAGKTSAQTCKYGKQTLQVGDKVTTKDECVECSCVYPPFAQCARSFEGKCASPAA